MNLNWRSKQIGYLITDKNYILDVSGTDSKTIWKPEQPHKDIIIEAYKH